MAPLPTDLRNQLAKAIQEARRVGEAGARKALAALAVDRDRPHGSMTKEQIALRSRLRAHGRQLGDARDRTRGTQETRRLAHEVAYEHWHRMLFARFLAENQLLIEPESGIAISMAECEELARERGEDPWALAGRFAERMLPRIFQPDDPALRVALAPETRQALERLLASLPAAVFTADDSLGWTYQFWQVERKDEVNESGVKIGADELPAVTQLFTEHYMVCFLFHNTIGAWRAGRLLAERPELAESAASEEELRRAVRLASQGGYDFGYLRFVREARAGDEEGKPTGPWRPAAGVFEGWSRKAAELRVLDPCCGSGHFLVEGFELLVPLRMEEEGLTVENAIRAVLEDNLFGLEIDPRCTQIAAFYLALAAWKLAGKPIELPPLQVACTGLALGGTKKEWLDLAGDDEKLRGGMTRLYDLFEKAPELGSLIDPHTLTQDQSTRDLYVAEFSDLQPLLVAALQHERRDEEQVERAVAAQGMARAAELLAGEYTLVITNVPYLGRKDHSNVLRMWADTYAKSARGDLATLFLSRAASWCRTAGTTAFVTSQNWLTMPTYRDFRKALLTTRTWHVVATLGEEAWQSFGDRGPRAVLLVISVSRPEASATSFHVDVSSNRGERVIPIEEKAELLRGQRTARIETVPQEAQLRNPDYRITHSRLDNTSFLSDYASSPQGIKTGDDPRFRCCFWEVSVVGRGWEPLQGASATNGLVGGLEFAVDWRQEGLNFSRLQGSSAWNRSGVVLRLLGKVSVSLHVGAKFDSNVTVVVPSDPSLLPALWAYCDSPEYAANLRAVEQAVKLNNATAVKVPFDPVRWRDAAAEAMPSGLPAPRSDYPTQWIFHGYPASADASSVLQVAVARLLGYRWPPEHDPAMRLAGEAREWVKRCRELEAYADEDGIVCLSATRGEAAAADRLRRLLAAAYGSAWSAAKERELLAAAPESGDRTGSLEEWLRDRFFEEHCKLFHQRPFVWHVWDGRKDGFHALANYHRLAGPDGEGRRTLQALTYSYLGDWIARQKAEQREGKEGADARLAAALDLQAQLERILAGDPPCDLFVRWKPLHRQPVGWEPDINDGVRLNIRPFVSVELRQGGRKGAGILRWKPNINWNKDRGNDPQSLRSKDDFPWFWSCPGDGSLADRTDFPGGPKFDGNRWNDLHYTNATKRAVRKPAQEG